jgi:hypothetical protein
LLWHTLCEQPWVKSCSELLTHLYRKNSITYVHMQYAVMCRHSLTCAHLHRNSKFTRVPHITRPFWFVSLECDWISVKNVVGNLWCLKLRTNYYQEADSARANPTIVSYNASGVKIYNTTGSQMRFENKNIFFYFEKRCSLLQRWRFSCKSKSLAPDWLQVRILLMYVGCQCCR